MMYFRFLIPDEHHRWLLKRRMAAFPLTFQQFVILALSMSKRKITNSGVSSATFSSSSAKNLNLYKKSYKGGGVKDQFYRIFQETLRETNAKSVFYPGCHRHLTTSLIFPDVTYVDCDSKVGPLFKEAAAKDYVEEQKLYNDETHYEFCCANVQERLPKRLPKKGEGYDLLISLSAGLLAGSCTSLVRPEGYLLVNDSHSDARSMFLDERWNLIAYWDSEEEKFTTNDLDQCFRAVDKKTKDEAPISEEQITESIAVGSVAKRSFRLRKDSVVYLFQKQTE